MTEQRVFTQGFFSALSPGRRGRVFISQVGILEDMLDGDVNRGEFRILGFLPVMNVDELQIVADTIANDIAKDRAIAKAQGIPHETPRQETRLYLKVTRQLAKKRRGQSIAQATKQFTIGLFGLPAEKVNAKIWLEKEVANPESPFFGNRIAAKEKIILRELEGVPVGLGDLTESDKALRRQLYSWQIVNNNKKFANSLANSLQIEINTAVDRDVINLGGKLTQNNWALLLNVALGIPSDATIDGEPFSKSFRDQNFLNFNNLWPSLSSQAKKNVTSIIQRFSDKMVTEARKDTEFIEKAEEKISGRKLWLTIGGLVAFDPLEMGFAVGPLLRGGKILLGKGASLARAGIDLAAASAKQRLVDKISQSARIIDDFISTRVALGRPLRATELDALDDTIAVINSDVLEPLKAAGASKKEITAVENLLDGLTKIRHQEGLDDLVVSTSSLEFAKGAGEKRLPGKLVIEGFEGKKASIGNIDKAQKSLSSEKPTDFLFNPEGRVTEMRKVSLELKKIIKQQKNQQIEFNLLVTNKKTKKVLEVVDGFRQRRQERKLSIAAANENAIRAERISRSLLPKEMIDNPEWLSLYNQHLRDIEQALTSKLTDDIKSIGLRKLSPEKLENIRAKIRAQMMRGQRPEKVLARQIQKGIKGDKTLILDRQQKIANLEKANTGLRVKEQQLSRLKKKVLLKERDSINRQITQNELRAKQLGREVEQIKDGTFFSKKDFLAPDNPTIELSDLTAKEQRLTGQLDNARGEVEILRRKLKSANESPSSQTISQIPELSRLLQSKTTRLTDLSEELSAVTKSKEAAASRSESVIEISEETLKGRTVADFVTGDLRESLIRGSEFADDVSLELNASQKVFEESIGPIRERTALAIPSQGIDRSEIFDLLHENEKFQDLISGFRKVRIDSETGSVSKLQYSLDPWNFVKPRGTREISTTKLEQAFDKFIAALSVDTRAEFTSKLDKFSELDRANVFRAILTRKLSDDAASVGDLATRSVLRGYLPLNGIPYLTDAEDATLLMRPGLGLEDIRKGVDIEDVKRAFVSEPRDAQITRLASAYAPRQVKDARRSLQNTVKTKIKEINDEILPGIEEGLKGADTEEAKSLFNLAGNHMKQVRFALQRTIDDPIISRSIEPNQFLPAISAAIGSGLGTLERATGFLKASKTIGRPIRYFMINIPEGAEKIFLRNVDNPIRAANIIGDMFTSGGQVTSRFTGRDVGRLFIDEAVDIGEIRGLNREISLYSKIVDKLYAPTGALDSIYRRGIGRATYNTEVDRWLSVLGKRVDDLSDVERSTIELMAVRKGRKEAQTLMFAYGNASKLSFYGSLAVPFWNYQVNTIKFLARTALDNPVLARSLSLGLQYDALVTDNQEKRKRIKDGRLKFEMAETGAKIDFSTMFITPQLVFGDAFTKRIDPGASFLSNEMDNILGNFGFWVNPITKSLMEIVSATTNNKKKFGFTLVNELERIVDSIEHFRTLKDWALAKPFASLLRSVGFEEEEIADLNSSRRQNFLLGKAKKELLAKDSEDISRPGRLSIDEIEKRYRDDEGIARRRFELNLWKQFGLRFIGLDRESFQDPAEKLLKRRLEQRYKKDVPNFRTTDEDIERDIKVMGDPIMGKSLAMLRNSAIRTAEQKAQRDAIDKNFPYLKDIWMFGLDERSFNYALRQRKARNAFFKMNIFKKKAFLRQNPDFRLFQDTVKDLFDQDEAISMFGSGNIKLDVSNFSKATKQQQDNLFMMNPLKFDMLRDLSSGSTKGYHEPFAVDAGLDPDTGAPDKFDPTLEAVTTETDQQTEIQTSEQNIPQPIPEIQTPLLQPEVAPEVQPAPEPREAPVPEGEPIIGG